MKLEGSLDAFSLPDIFQLLSFTKKSGGLHLAQGGSDGVVFFAAGLVTGASADSSRQPLARRIVGSGAVSDEALSAAVEAVSAGEGLGVVRALLESGAVDADLLRQAAQDQSTDAIFDLLRWQEGDFAFVMDETNPDDVGVTVAIDAVLAEAEARRATWESVSQVVPSPRSVMVMPVVLTAEPAVSREEWSLLALVDGRRSVAELVDLTGSGQYAVVSTLAALVQRGLLAVREDVGQARSRTTSPSCCAASSCWPRSRRSLRSSCRRSPPSSRPATAISRTYVRRSPRRPRPTPRSRCARPTRLARRLAGRRPRRRLRRRLAASAGTTPTTSSTRWQATRPRTTARTRTQSATWSAPRPARSSRRCSAARTCRRTSSRRVRSPSCPSGRPSSTSTAACRPPERPARSSPRAAATSTGGSSLGDVVGATATAPDPAAASVIERDPNVNRSLMLRLIAGVRGL